jgi:hypothetical protein
MTDLGSNPGRCRRKPETNCLSYGTALPSCLVVLGHGFSRVGQIESYVVRIFFQSDMPAAVSNIYLHISLQIV